MKTRSVTVEKIGVVRVESWDDVPIKVNDQDMAILVDNAVKQCAPEMDNEGRFAGKISITVEMYGDFEDEETRK